MSDPTPPPTRPAGRGCFFYGCLTCIALFLVGCLAVFLGVRFLYGQFNAYTDTAPMKLPTVEMADAEYQDLEARVKTFSDALEKGTPIPPLTLNEREINAIFLKGGKSKELAEKVYVSLDGDKVKGQVSLPLSKPGTAGKGRYLNGEATFKVSLENGELVVTLQEMLVKGKPIPNMFMKTLRGRNLAQELDNDPKKAEAIQKFESIKVRDSLVTIQVRTNAVTTP